MACLQIGLLFKEALEFDAAVEWQTRALRADPDDIGIMTQLASTLSRSHVETLCICFCLFSCACLLFSWFVFSDARGRQGDVPAAVRMAELAMEKSPRESLRTCPTSCVMTML